jgi:hypothetical protein
VRDAVDGLLHQLEVAVGRDDLVVRVGDAMLQWALFALPQTPGLGRQLAERFLDDANWHTRERARRARSETVSGAS